jgi:hypothetical protein
MGCTMNYFDFTLRFISEIDWKDPKVALILILLSIFALLRKWFLLLTLIFLIVFGEGLFYLLSKRGYPVSMLENIGLGIYLGCGIFLAVVAFHNFFFKD